MNKLLIALLFSSLSTAYAVTDNPESNSAANQENTQVQKQQNKIDKNNKKTSSQKARETKSKEKGMHIKDEVTDTNDNEPADAVEIKSPAPTKSKSN